MEEPQRKLSTSPILVVVNIADPRTESETEIGISEASKLLSRRPSAHDGSAALSTIYDAVTVRLIPSSDASAIVRLLQARHFKN